MLSKMTVKELKETAQRMNVPFHARILKADLVAAIKTQIELDHTRALEDEAFRNETEPDTYTIEIEGREPVVITDRVSVTILKNHEKCVRRFNPTMKRDKNGMVILTPKQRRRVQKHTHKLAKKEGLYYS